MKQVPVSHFHEHDMQHRFLIADRDPAIREQARRILINRGHAAYTAADGLQCIEQLRQISPTFLVLDPQIPWGGGDGVLEWLHDESPFSEVKVLLVDEGGSGSMSAIAAKQITGHLNRPRNAAEIVQFINTLLHESTDHRFQTQG